MPVFRWMLGKVRSYESHFLVAVVLLASAEWGFVELADEVTEGATASLDEVVLLALRSPGDATDPLGSVWLEEIACDVTSFGAIGVLVLVTGLPAERGCADDAPDGLTRVYLGVHWLIDVLAGGCCWRVWKASLSPRLTGSMTSRSSSLISKCRSKLPFQALTK